MGSVAIAAVQTILNKCFPERNRNRRETVTAEPEPDITKLQKSSELPAGITSSLTTLFVYLRWFFMIPYKLEYSEQTSTYEVTTNNCRRVIIWTLQLVFTVNQAIMVTSRLRLATSLSTVIRAIINGALTSWSNVTLIMLWRNREAFAGIMSRLDSISLKLEMRGAQFTRRRVTIAFVTTVSLACVILSFMEVGYFHLRIFRDQRYLKPVDVIVEQAFSLRTYFPDLEATGFGMTLLWIYGFGDLVITRLYYFSIGHFGYAVLYILCVTVGKLYRALNATIPEEMSSKAEIEDAINLYSEIRSFTAEVNKAIGSMMAWGILAHLPYNAYKVNDLLCGCLFTQASYIIHVIIYLGILFAGAKVHSQLNTFTDRLACDKLVLQDSELEGKVSLLVQQSRLAGMRGGGVFLMTFGFLGNIIGVILTYAILIVQFKQRQ